MNTVSNSETLSNLSKKESSNSSSFKEDVTTIVKGAALLYKESEIAVNNAIKSIPKEKFIEIERMNNYKYKQNK